MFGLFADSCLDEGQEQRMWFQYRAAVFRMELCTDKPFQGRDFHDFHQVGFRIDTYALHTRLFEFFLVAVVEFVTVAVTFLDVFTLVSLISLGVRVDNAFISSQTHGTAHVGDGFLFLHDVDYIVRSLFIHFTAVGIGISQYVSCEFDDNTLHTQTDTECRYVVCTAVLDSCGLTFDTTLSESRADDDTVHVFQVLFNVVVGQVLAIDKVNVGLAVIISCSL